MKIGINYDTGIFPGARQSRPFFDSDQVAFDMRAIATDLHASMVRITGGDIQRIATAGELAAGEGLDVWVSPHPCELGEDQMLAVFHDAARAAEALRRQYPDKVKLVLGCEVGVFGRGFLPGVDAYARMAELAAPSPALYGEYPQIATRLNAFLSRAAAQSKQIFSGPITYASGMWEPVDWTPFDIAGVDAYRDESNTATFDQQLQAVAAAGKPVVVTEFGCCTYRGAAARGANGWTIEPKNYPRDETEQVRYLQDLVRIFDQRGIQAAFWFTFASWNRPHRPDSVDDPDLASFGLVKVTGSEWRPKAAFCEFRKLAQKCT